MKKLLKNKIHKSMAVTLIIMMVFVPFIFDSGLGFRVEGSAPPAGDITLSEGDGTLQTDPDNITINKTYYYGGGTVTITLENGMDPNIKVVKVNTLTGVVVEKTVASESELGTIITDTDTDSLTDTNAYYLFYKQDENDTTKYQLGEVFKVEKKVTRLLFNDFSYYNKADQQVIVTCEEGYVTGQETESEKYIGKIKYAIVNDTTNIADVAVDSWINFDNTAINLGDVEGKYKIYIAYFINNAICVNIDSVFAIDATVPTAKTPVLKVCTKTSAHACGYGSSSCTWENAPATGKLNPNKTYRYEIQISDKEGLSDTDLSSDLLTTAEKGLTSNIGNIIINTANKAGVAFVEVIATQGGTISGKLIFGDKAGNKSAEIALPTRVFSSGDIQITVTDKVGGSLISENQFINNAVTGKAYTVNVTISSDVNIVNYSVNATEKIESSETSIILAEATGLTSNTMSFDLTVPKNMSVNNLLNSIEITAETEYGDTKTQSIGNILYDQTKPEIVSNNSSTTWAKNTNVMFTFTDTAGDKEELGMATGKYTISNSASAVTDVNIPEVVKKTTASKSIEIPESLTTAGTEIKFTVTDKAGNSNIKSFTYYVDKTAPTIGIGLNGMAYSANYSKPVNGSPIINYEYSDNLTISSGYLEIISYDGKIERIEFNEKDINGSSVSGEYTLKNNKDGAYSATIFVTDKAGNSSIAKSFTFTLDNTLPVLDAKIVSGISEKSDTFKGSYTDGTTYGYYYKGNVGVKFYVTETSFDPSKAIVIDNGNTKTVQWIKEGDQWVAVTTISGEGKHTVSVECTDSSGNTSKSKGLDFIIDNTAPSISTTINGLGYIDADEFRMFQSDAFLNVLVADPNKDSNDLVMAVITTKPDEAGVSQSNKVSEGDFGYSEEADYKVYLVAKDRSNNASTNNEVNFRIDKTAPALEISGIASGGAAQSQVTITYQMIEAFYWDMQPATISVYKQVDGEAESLVKTTSFSPTAKQSSMTEVYSEDGVYRIEYNATDRAGNISNVSHTFSIDANAPVIELSGVSNYDKTNKEVTVNIKITEDFYTTNNVKISGTVEDIDGVVKSIDFGTVSVNGSKVSEIIRSFSNDGIYDITVESIDKAGNSSSNKVHFTIDKTPPQISGFEKYDGKILSEFVFTENITELVKDLTVCKVDMYLDGLLYSEGTVIEDGVHNLVIVAVDEMDQESRMEISFTIDQTPPAIMITGVEDGKKYYEGLDIEVGVQIEEDTLTSVLLNGKEMSIIDNDCSISITEKDDYKLTAIAVDEAGNETITTISFDYANKTNWLLIIGIGVGGLTLISVIIIVIRKLARR